MEEINKSRYYCGVPHAKNKFDYSRFSPQQQKTSIKAHERALYIILEYTGGIMISSNQTLI